MSATLIEIHSDRLAWLRRHVEIIRVREGNRAARLDALRADADVSGDYEKHDELQADYNTASAEDLGALLNTIAATGIA